MFTVELIGESPYGILHWTFAGGWQTNYGFRKYAFSQFSAFISCKHITPKYIHCYHLLNTCYGASLCTENFTWVILFNTINNSMSQCHHMPFLDEEIKCCKVMKMVGAECGFKSVTPGFEFQLCNSYLHDVKILCFLQTKWSVSNWKASVF